MPNIQPIPDARRTMKLFLEEAPPLVEEEVKADIDNTSRIPGHYFFNLKWPSILLYCGSKECDGDHFFDPEPEHDTANLGELSVKKLYFLIYTCRHCKATRKIFAIAVTGETKNDATAKISMMKFGEDPPAIGPAPRALQDLLGDQWQLYLKARRSELAGLGIGSFTYYRRIIEHVWQTVLARLVQVARIEGSADKIAALEAAQQQREFTRSMEQAKEFIPGSLYVNGHNPFQALYDACGDGIHEYSDEECIKRSRIIRLVLRRFSERAKAVLSEDTEFRTAVGSLAGKTGQDAGS